MHNELVKNCTIHIEGRNEIRENKALFKSCKENVRQCNKSRYQNVINKLESRLIFVKKNGIIYKKPYGG